MMRCRVLNSLGDIPAALWNSLDLQGNPFLRHEFLFALEDEGCVTAATGWAPQHLIIEDADGTLLGAMPLYLKNHSWGEFVFDWGWANAYSRAGLEYYPKLVCAVPFTPASGPRLLVRMETAATTASCGPASGTGPLDTAALRRRPTSATLSEAILSAQPGQPGFNHRSPQVIRAALVSAALQLATENKLSSVHVLFSTEVEENDLQQARFLPRHDCQFHWQNRGYGHFEDFLATFRADKRKKAKRERRRVQEAGITFDTLQGADIDDELWDAIYAFSCNTFARHGHEHYLTAAFFKRLTRTLPECIMVKLARYAGQPVAAAIFFEGDDTLYGRYWGAVADFDSLHFETCYYQGIDYCIQKGLARFEPGTQGEHKVPRGFEPSVSHSAHWLADRRFARAVGDFLTRENAALVEYMSEMREHVPFRRQPDAASFTDSAGVLTPADMPGNGEGNPRGFDRLAD